MELLLLAATIIVAALIFISIKRGEFGDKTGGVKPDSEAPRQEIATGSKQIEALKLVGVKPAPLMNSSELKLFGIVRETCAAHDSTLLVFAQPNLGEFLNTERGERTRQQEITAYNAFNAKRVDIAVFSAKSDPLLGIEFNGAGHNRGNAKERDAIKQLAFAKAGLPLLIVKPDYSEIELRERIGAALGYPISS